MRHSYRPPATGNEPKEDTIRAHPKKPDTVVWTRNSPQPPRPNELAYKLRSLGYSPKAIARFLEHEPPAQHTHIEFPMG